MAILTATLAGLDRGGTVVALAAQKTLENLIARHFLHATNIPVKRGVGYRYTH
jgi:hypothetical protein